MENYKVNKSLTATFWQSLLLLLNRISNFFSLKTAETFWGIVYDSHSKQPLDPVIVKLLYTDGREIETCVTDLEGRYGFLARPGKFKIFVRKTNYTFPSTKVLGDNDGVYENLYHGEFFVLYNNSEVVAPNIPMDPAKFDWNQKAKLGVLKKHPYWKLFFKKLAALIFWLSFLLSSYGFWHFSNNIAIYLYYIFGGFLFLLFLSLITPQARLWGKVKIKAKTINSEGLLLELQNPKFVGMSFGQARVREDGKFLLRGSKGEYLLTINKIGSDGEKIILAKLPVKISGRGVLNSTFILKL